MTAPDLLTGLLVAAGVRRSYGRPIPGLAVEAADPAVAGVLARAHQVVMNAPSAVVIGPESVELPGRTADDAIEIEVASTDDLPGLATRLRRASAGGGARLQLSVDVEQPWPASVEAEGSPDPWLAERAEQVELVEAAEKVVILAGPGVVAGQQVPGLHALAGRVGSGVLNTWGAKGIFHWRSRRHLATIGLQRDDFVLGGLADADLVLVVGVDEREAPAHEWSQLPHLVIQPDEAGPLSELLKPRPDRVVVPPLRIALAAATQAGWQSVTAPIAPSRATAGMGRRLAPGGLLAADAGPAGFWVARTFSTTELGAVAVPPYLEEGWAAACVAIARLADPLRPALAVIDDEVDPVTQMILEWAAARALAVGVEIWSDAGPALSGDEHEARLADLAGPKPGPPQLLATDATQLAVFEAAAGPVRSWLPPARGA